MKVKKRTVKFDTFYEVAEISFAIAVFLSEHPDSPNKLLLRSFLELLSVVCHYVEFEER